MPSNSSNQSLEMLNTGDLDRAMELARAAVNEHPDDWHGHYAQGQCLRCANDFSQAAEALGRANNLHPEDPSVATALAIAKQLDGDLEGAISALREALELDSDHALAYNSLGMTQKLMGEYEKASNTYNSGAEALSRLIVRSLKNSADCPRLPHQESRNNLWNGYAAFAVLYCCATEPSADIAAWPTGDMALKDSKTAYLQGWYWQDSTNEEGELVRLFCPNFFNTFFQALWKDSLYATMMGNRSTVLELLGQSDEARKHLEEAEDFSSHLDD